MWTSYTVKPKQVCWCHCFYLPLKQVCNTAHEPEQYRLFDFIPEILLPHFSPKKKKSHIYLPTVTFKPSSAVIWLTRKRPPVFFSIISCVFIVLLKSEGWHDSLLPVKTGFPNSDTTDLESRWLMQRMFTRWLTLFSSFVLNVSWRKRWRFKPVTG